MVTRKKWLQHTELFPGKQTKGGQGLKKGGTGDDQCIAQMVNAVACENLNKDGDQTVQNGVTPDYCPSLDTNGIDPFDQTEISEENLELLQQIKIAQEKNKSLQQEFMHQTLQS